MGRGLINPLFYRIKCEKQNLKNNRLWMCIQKQKGEIRNDKT